MNGIKRKGLFISFEGIDGSGKTVQAKRLYEQLKKAGYAVILIREPGGTAISEAIRDILLDRQYQNMTNITELLLYQAARAQLIQERIVPELNNGTIVLTDRFADSTIAYQAFGRQIPIDIVMESNRFACADSIPDRTYVLDIPLVESQRRMFISKKMDRMEKEKISFFEQVRDGYLEIAKKEPNRVYVLDGLKPMDTLEHEIFEDVLLCIQTAKILKKEH